MTTLFYFCTKDRGTLLSVRRGYQGFRCKMRLSLEDAVYGLRIDVHQNPDL